MKQDFALRDDHTLSEEAVAFIRRNSSDMQKPRSICGSAVYRILTSSQNWTSATRLAVICAVTSWRVYFDLAALWQAGFRNTTCAIGMHLTPVQCSQLCDQPGRCVYIAFDQGPNHAGSTSFSPPRPAPGKRRYASPYRCLAARTQSNSYMVAGATAADFRACLQEAGHL